MQAARLFIFFAFGYFLSNFLRAANAVIAADLSRDLSLTAADLGLMTSLFYVGFALVQLPLGVALDRWGPRMVIPTLMLATVVGCLAFASAASFPMLAAGRTMIGVGMAGNLMGALVAFARWFPPGRVATITGVMVGLGAAGGLVAATPLAWLNGLVGWRAVFFWSALVTLASAAAIALGTRNAPGGSPLRAMRSGKGQGFDLIFRDSRFWRIATIDLFLVGTLLAVQTLWGGPYLFDVHRMSKIEAGNLLLAMSGGVVAGYMSGGWLADRLGAQRVTMLAVAVFALAQLAFVLPGGPPPVWALWLVYAVFGFTGAFNLVLLAQIRGLFPPEMSGRAVTAVNMFGFGGAALLQWWMGLIVGSFAPDPGGRYPVEAYAAAFSFTLAGTAIALVWYSTLAFPRRRPAGVAAESGD